jgi:hypothetical protein
MISNRLILKQCDTQWKVERQGHNRHIGKTVCACLSLVVTQHQEANAQTLKQLLAKATPVCLTAGILENTVNRAVFEREQDQSFIQSICDSSWIGLMKTYHPNDPKFDSKKICSCARLLQP